MKRMIFLLIIINLLTLNICINALPDSGNTIPSRNTLSSENTPPKFKPVRITASNDDREIYPKHVLQQVSPQKIVIYKDYQEIKTILKDISDQNAGESKANLLQSMENTLTAVDIILALIAVFITVLGLFLRWGYKKVNEKLKKIDHLSILDETDTLIKIKISAIQKTLILCLEKAPSRDIAFSTYSKLLAAYELLLNNSHKNNISPEMQEEMEMGATLIQGNRQYVPKEIIRFMIENMGLPYKIRGILWGKNER